MEADHKIVFVRKVIGPVVDLKETQNILYKCALMIPQILKFRIWKDALTKSEFPVLLNRIIGPVKKLKNKVKNEEGLKKFRDIRTREKIS